MNLALSKADQVFTTDTPTKATVIYDVPFGNTSYVCSVVQTTEASAEKVTGGNLRIMGKSTFRVPKPNVDLNGVVRFGAPEIVTIHTVISLPKAWSDTVANSSVTDILLRKGLAYLLAKGMNDVSSILQGASAQAAAPADLDTLANTLFAATGAVRRAAAGLQPLDAANGLYAGAV